MKRKDMLAALSEKNEVWDVLVIGGGATGLGTALEAASRGHRTALVEAHDFGKGTSSRSTKLIHGGVRYLRSGQIGMVRESLLERERLVRNAPHLVHSLRFLIPAYRRGARWYYYAGMKAYDLLARSQNFAASKVHSTEQTHAYCPSLNSDGLRGSVSYSDGQFDDARLALALAQSIADAGGVVCNYANVVKLAMRPGGISQVIVEDSIEGSTLELSARAVVNATGVFSDALMRLEQDVLEQDAPKVVASQGTHLVLDRSFLASDHAILIPDTSDGRVLFAIPWLDRTLIGTTDNPVASTPLEPRPLEGEIDYLLESIRPYFQNSVDVSDIRSVFSGLRPLVGDKSGGRSTAKLSREHEVFVSKGGLITIIGGKWTTYRKMGEDVVDLASKVAGFNKYSSVTAELRLHGAQGIAKDTSEYPHLAQYGDVAATVLEDTSSESRLKRLHPRLPYLECEVNWAVEHEMAQTLEDVLARRTRALFLDAQVSLECAPMVAELMRQKLGQNRDWMHGQLEAFSETARGYLAVS